MSKRRGRKDSKKESATSSYLAKSLANVRRRSEMVSLNYGRADPSIMLGNANMFGFMSDLGQRELLTKHQEQLSHYTGYTYALIRTGTNAIAGQPVHVGKFKEESERSTSKRRRLGGRPGQRKFMQDLVPKSLQPYTEDVDVITDHAFLR